MLSTHEVDAFCQSCRAEPDGCWIWTGTISSNGYGQFIWNHRSVGAHRMAYQLFVGPIPKDREIDHLCCRRSCVNPAHLELVTASENIRRRWRRQRPDDGVDLTAMKRSPTHPGEAFDIEVLQALNVSQGDAARRMGISKNRLNEICRWKRPVTAESAVLMAKVSGTSAQLWLRLQADYDLWHALKTTDTSKVRPLEPLEA